MVFPKVPAVQPPIFSVGFKSYIEGTGKRALEIAKIAESVSLKTGICIIVEPQFVDIAALAREVSIPVFAQHIDPIEPGASTGHVLPEAVKEAGAAGTMINHAERRLTLTDIHRAIKRARENKLKSMVCVDTPEEASAIARLKPDIVAAEPPKLIGTGRAVSRFDTGFVTKSVEMVKAVDPNIMVLAGAGISTGKDAEVVLSLGADGTGAASAIVKAKDPYKLLMEMAEGVKLGFERRHRKNISAERP